MGNGRTLVLLTPRYRQFLSGAASESVSNCQILVAGMDSRVQPACSVGTVCAQPGSQECCVLPLLAEGPVALCCSFGEAIKWIFERKLDNANPAVAPFRSAWLKSSTCPKASSTAKFATWMISSNREVEINLDNENEYIGMSPGSDGFSAQPSRRTGSAADQRPGHQNRDRRQAPGGLHPSVHRLQRW